MAAAVADYRPVEGLAAKRPREGGWSLELEQTGDILAAIGAARTGTRSCTTTVPAR